MIYSAWLTFLLPLAAVPLIPLVSLLDSRLRAWLAVAVTGVTFAIAAVGAYSFSGATTETLAVWLPNLNVSLQVEADGLSLLVAAFVSFVSFLVVVYSVGYMKDEPGQTRYYSLVLLFVGSMLGLVLSGNLLQFYFFWELVGICSALLIAFWTDRPAARRAGMKAFVVTRLGDASLLIAVIAVWTLFGTTSFESFLGPSSLSTLGSGTAFAIGLLMFIGAMGKSAQVPLHGWLPDAMEGPTTVSALIHAATMVNAGVFLMLRVYPLLALSGSLLALMTAVGLLSALVGGACAVASDDLKRVLAYSTISQLGLMFVAIGLGSWQAGAYHLISQGLFKALAFLAAGSVITALETRNMDEMGGLARTMKYTYLGFLLSVLAMSGLPPLVGFWSKDAILSLALARGPFDAVLVLGAFALTALYSFRALFRVFHGEPRAARSAGESPATMLGPILVLSASLATAWFALQSQGLVDLSTFSSPDPQALSLSLVVLALVGTVSYASSLRFYSAVSSLVVSTAPLKSLQKLLHAGLGFDRLYDGVYSSVLAPLASAAAAIQTGKLRSNVGLAGVLILLLFILFATGVL